MNDTAILLPVMALVGWTIFILLNVPFRRFRAAFKQQVTEVDFRLGESKRVPAEVSLPNRNFMNLLEAPVLFYVVCLVYYVSGAAITSFVPLAWTYVATRVVHSLIHITYNNVRHRMLAFAASTVVLVVTWSMLLRELL
jgi:hypothetical protein